MPASPSFAICAPLLPPAPPATSGKRAGFFSFAAPRFARERLRGASAAGGRRCAVSASSTNKPPSSPPPSEGDSGPIGTVRDFLAGISRVAGIGQASGAADATFEVDRDGVLGADDGEPPEVLVAGATGETGRIVVRKLLLRGYRVRVLVRNLYSSTLDLLGTGVSYVKGDLSDHDALLDCVGDVDKIICAVGPTIEQTAEEVDFRGISNLISAFQDSRVLHFGRSEATKLRLFDFGRADHFSKWKVLPPVAELNTRETRVSFTETSAGRKAFMGQVFGMYSGLAEMRTVPAKINLRGFSGLILRAIGDGKMYRFVLRTQEGAKAGIEYVAPFKTRKGKWETIRIPFSTFIPRDGTSGAVKSGTAKLSRADIRQMAVQYTKPEESPEKDDGQFYLAIDYIKTYRTQDEPDFVLVSCASVTNRNAAALDDAGLRDLASDDSSAWKYMAEKRLRNSGLTYTIVRPGTFTQQPGGAKAIMLEQSGDLSGVISRADVAEICVKALLDPRACNVTFDAFESMYAPTASSPANQDMSSLLGRLRPNT